MCEKFCSPIETFNPEVEYQKFLKRKPVVQTYQLYEELHTREKIKCPCKSRFVWIQGWLVIKIPIFRIFR